MTDTSAVGRLASAVLAAAQRAVDRGQWDDASELARQVLDVLPGDPTAQSLLAAVEARGRGALDQGRRYLTVLFSDVVGSTALSERLDPEDYFGVVAAYREAVREVVALHDGHVDQFQGDGVVAYFGFPVAAEDDQVRAVEAGLDIVLAVREAGRRIGVELEARVGVHVGRTVMTNSELGARDRSTAIGFATNVAARIQGLAEPGTVVVSETAVEAISPYFELKLVGARHLRGVSEDVRVFRVFEPRARSTMRDDRLGVLLVGRRDERRRIDDAWRAVRGEGEGEDPRVVLITGEPGIGKSRLARYAMDLARQDGGSVIEINCGRDFRHVGLGAVRRGIEKALELGSTPRSGQTRAALEARGRLFGLAERSVQALEALMGDPAPARPTPELAPDRLREAIIGALQEWVAAEAAVAPVALVVEDLHWADDTAIETLRRLTSQTLPPRLLVLMTARTGEVPKALEHLLAGAVQLDPLTNDAATEMARSFAGGGNELDDAAVEALARRGEGVPLFTEHLVMAAKAHPTQPGQPGDTLPATLEGLLQVRLAASGPGRRVAELAAVIGREFSLELVERVLVELGDGAPLPPAAVASALRDLQRAGLVEPSGEATMRFRHSLVRDVAYELQLRTERPRRHRAVARAIVSLHGPDAAPEGLAHHLEQAGDLEPAASAFLRASEGAAGLAEFDLALEHLHAAGAIIARVEGPAARRLELAHCMQTGSVSAASFSYTRDEAERAYLRAMELCDLIGADEGPDVGLDVQLVAAL
nr:AAA family ATPase [Acidimicrobiia bacterium]